MPTLKRLTIALLIIVICCSWGASKGVNVSEEGHLCNLKVEPDESNQRDITNLVSWLLEQTPVLGFSQSHDYKGYHGAAACSGKISIYDCDYCLDYAKKQIFNMCGFSDGGQIKLADCRLRYEVYEFPPDCVGSTDVEREKLSRKLWIALPEDGTVMIVGSVLPEDPEHEYKGKGAVIPELNMTVLNLRGEERKDSVPVRATF